MKKTSITLKQLKKIISESSADDIIFSSENFEFVRKSGIGYRKTPWKGLGVISKNLAKKHVVNIELETAVDPEFNGEPVEFRYEEAYISHGMRMSKDSLDDIKEYIKVLQEAVDFVEQINDYLRSHNLKKDLDNAFGNEEEFEELEEGFEDPNPPSKKCPDCGAQMRYNMHSMSYNCPRCSHYERGLSRVRQ